MPKQIQQPSKIQLQQTNGDESFDWKSPETIGDLNVSDYKLPVVQSSLRKKSIAMDQVDSTELINKQNKQNEQS